MKNYVGQIVVLTRRTSNGEANPLSGLHVCIEQTLDMLFALPLDGGLDSAEVRAFVIKGKDAWDVSPRGYDPDAITDLIDELGDLYASRHMPNPAFCQSAYTKIPSAVRHLEFARNVAHFSLELMAMADALEEFGEALGDLLAVLEEAAEEEAVVGPTTSCGCPAFTMKESPVVKPFTVEDIFNIMRTGALPPFAGKV